MNDERGSLFQSVDHGGGARDASPFPRCVHGPDKPGAGGLPVKFGHGLNPTPFGIAPWGVVGFGTDDGPDACDALSSFVRRGGSQWSTETCVWWAIAGALWGTLGLHGLPPLWISVLAGYWLTRRRTARGGAIADLGCRPTDAAEVVREAGVVPVDAWPFTVANVDAEPDFGALIAAPDHEWFALRRVVAEGDARNRNIRRALSAPGCEARFVLHGQALDAEAQRWTPERGPYARNGRPVVGRHMELCASYGPDGLDHVSSWGMADRRDAWEQVASGDTSDVWIVEMNADLARAVAR